MSDCDGNGESEPQKHQLGKRGGASDDDQDAVKVDILRMKCCDFIISLQFTLNFVWNWMKLYLSFMCLQEQIEQL